MFDLIASNIGFTANGAFGLHQDMRLYSAFQPIYSLSHSSIVGYEALLRATDMSAKPVSPALVFDAAKTESEIVHLDRLSRALHMRNFCSQDNQASWLFLNIDPQVIVEGKHYGAFFRDLLEQHQMPAARVVVEILEGAISDEGQLSDSVDFYKNLGCLIALDDFGVGHSNFERIWRLSPDIIKLDRSMIAQAVQKPSARRLLPGIVSLIHEAGSLVLIEGVESYEEAAIAMDTDVDLIQGFYFGTPEPQLRPNRQSEAVGELFKRYNDANQAAARSKRLSMHGVDFTQHLQ